MSPADSINAAAKSASAAPRYSTFATTLASALHANDFIGAAEHIERSLLDAGVKLLNSKLPPAVADAVAPIEQAAESTVVQVTDDVARGNTPAIGADLASGLGQGLLDLLARYGLKIG